MEREPKAEQNEDVHDEKARDVAQYDILEHDGEGVHCLETLGELQREHPTDDEDDGYHFDVEAGRRAAAVQRVPDDRGHRERQRRQLSEVAEQGRQQSERQVEYVGPKARRQPATFAGLVFAVNGGASCHGAPVTVA